MQDVILDYTALLSNGFLGWKVVWTSFWGKLWPKLWYPLSTMSFSKKQSSTLVTPLYKHLLPKLGVVLVLPLPYRYCMKKYLGLGLPCPHLEKIIAKLDLILTHYSLPSQPGQHLRHAFEELQFQLGLDTPFLHLPYSTYGCHLPTGWLHDLWSGCDLYPI